MDEWVACWGYNASVVCGVEFVFIFVLFGYDLVCG